MEYNFGSGNLFGISGANNVPRKFGALQDVTLDFSFNLKELYGQYQFPLAIARGQGKITGKAKFASVHGGMLNELFFGQTLATGQALGIIGEAGVIPSTPYQVTVAQGATFQDDLGVVFTATGVPLTRVAAAPAANQYSVSAAGVYTFAAADTTKAVLIDYSYTVAGGNKITINNLLAGTSTPQFIAVLNLQFQSKQMHLRLNACFSEKMAFATKIEDFIIPEFDFRACADVSNVIGTLGLAE